MNLEDQLPRPAVQRQLALQRERAQAPRREWMQVRTPEMRRRAFHLEVVKGLIVMGLLILALVGAAAVNPSGLVR